MEHRSSCTTSALCNVTKMLPCKPAHVETDQEVQDDTRRYPTGLYPLVSFRPPSPASQLTFPSLTKNLYDLTSFLPFLTLNGPSFTSLKANASSFSDPPFHQHCPRILQQCRD